jgi:ferrochelatase
VLLMAYGGPHSLDDVEPYLLDVRGGRPTPAELVEEIRHRYTQIGGRSPLLEVTMAQAAALEERLNHTGAASLSPDPRFQVYVGMRHWTPYIAEAVERIAADGHRRVIALCMAPHASRMSTGAYLQKLRQAVEAQKAGLQVDFVESWHTQPSFIDALVEQVQAARQRFSRSALVDLRYLFSAHSLPVSIIEQGDPYASQLQETAQLLADRLGLQDRQWQFCYQSAGAQGSRWLGPDILEVVDDLAERGVHDVLVTPIGFVADHVEVLFDLDIETRQHAAALGMRLERSPSLNTNPTFIEALAQVVTTGEPIHIPDRKV